MAPADHVVLPVPGSAPLRQFRARWKRELAIFTPQAGVSRLVPLARLPNLSAPVISVDRLFALKGKSICHLAVQRGG